MDSTIATFTKWEFLNYLNEDFSKPLKECLVHRKKLIRKLNRKIPKDIMNIIWKFIWSYPMANVLTDINLINTEKALTINKWRCRGWTMVYGKKKEEEFGYYVIWNSHHNPETILFWQNHCCDPKVYIIKKNLENFML